MQAAMDMASNGLDAIRRPYGAREGEHSPMQLCTSLEDLYVREVVIHTVSSNRCSWRFSLLVQETTTKPVLFSLSIHIVVVLSRNHD